MFHQSLILSSIFTAYENSAVKKYLIFLKRKFSVVSKESSFLQYIKRDGRLQEYFDKSIFYKILLFLAVLPVLLPKLLFQKFEQSFESSRTVNGVRTMLKNFDYMLALCLFITIVTPHNSWNNLYSLVFVILLVVLFMIRAVIFRHEWLDIGRLSFVFFTYMLVVVLSTISSVDISLSLRFFLFHFTNFLYLIVMVMALKTERGLRIVLRGVALGVVAISLLALWQVATNSVPFDPALTDPVTNQGMPGRVFATLSNPNNLAEVLILVFPFLTVLFVDARTRGWKILTAFGGFAMLGALAYTGSRSGWMGFLFSVLVLILLKRPAWVFIFIFAGVAVFPVLPEFLTRRFMTLGNISADSSIMYRVKIFHSVVPMIKDYWLTGVGIGSDIFVKIMNRYQLLTPVPPAHSHMVYTQILIETGVLGLVTFLWTVFKGMKDSVVQSFKCKDPFLKNILHASVASISGILIVSFVEYVWFYPRVMLMFWVVMGLMFAGLSVTRNKKHFGVKEDRMEKPLVEEE